MNARVSSLLLLLLAGATLGCNEQRDPGQWPLSREQLTTNQPADTSDGPAALTYRRYCVGCHGDDGRGNGGLTGADFTGPDSPLGKNDAELLSSVRNGKLGKRATMPPHQPVLKDHEISAVIAYVRKRFGSSP